MKRFRLCALALFGCVVMVGYAQEKQVNSNTVVISFANNKGGEPGRICSKSLPWETQDYFNLEKMECKNDQAYYFKVENFPAGAKLTLSSEKDCKTADNFEFAVRGTKHPFQMEWMKISDVKGYSVGQMIKPGLKLIEKYFKDGGSYDGKLSCFRYSY